jgi:hypothetical protein
VNALALDAQYKPIPVVHSDGGFALLFQDPPPEQVEELVTGMLRPFPAGLLTEAGLVVANPVFADASRQRMFGRTAYHGTVTWSWQQALLAAGLDRQVARHDLSAEMRQRLRASRQQLWSVIESTRELRASELWSWQYVDGRYRTAPFGQNSGDADESNAAQLWSTVYLAIPQPPPDAALLRPVLENRRRLVADREHRGVLDVALHRDRVELATDLARGTELSQPGFLAQLFQQYARDRRDAATGARELAQ